MDKKIEVFQLHNLLNLTPTKAPNWVINAIKKGDIKLSYELWDDTIQLVVKINIDETCYAVEGIHDCCLVYNNCDISIKHVITTPA